MRIAITGISGSFGSALCADLVRNQKNIIVGMTRDELRAEQIMARHPGNVRVMVVAAGLQDTNAMERAFRDCDVLIHAAALKRISGSVYATEEIVKVNILGTINILEVARRLGIQKTLVISSDKACEATNLYGSSKFTAECLAVQSNAFIYPATGGMVSCTRWGNVVGSRGSVVHIWRKQRDSGGPITVTDARMTRFIITMAEAVQFTMQALHLMQGGEIFIPKLRAASMVDLAQAVRDEHVMGRNAITYTGLRPGGEKIHEILLTQEEPRRTVPVAHGLELAGGIPYFLVQPSHRTWSNKPYDKMLMDRLLPESFSYSSLHAPKLSRADLHTIVCAVPKSQEE